MKDVAPWRSCQFFWAEEACLPFDDQASSYGQAKRLLFDRVPGGSGAAPPRAGGPLRARGGGPLYMAELRTYFIGRQARVRPDPAGAERQWRRGRHLARHPRRGRAPRLGDLALAAGRRARSGPGLLHLAHPQLHPHDAGACQRRPDGPDRGPGDRSGPPRACGPGARCSGSWIQWPRPG